MVGNGAFLRLATVLRVNAVWEVPFDQGPSRDQWHIVQVIDLGLELDVRPAAGADDVALTVDYGVAAALVYGIGTGPGVQLVETLAERIAATLLAAFPVLVAVEVEVAKIHPPCPTVFSAATIQIRREREP